MRVFRASRSLATVVVVVVVAAMLSCVRAAGDTYLIGVGKADITGPVVEIPFHGYAVLSQVGTGLRQRLYARSFIIADAANPADKFLYIVVDTQAGDTATRLGVLEGLKALGGDYAGFTQKNVAVIGTHSHSGPGGWHNYLLHQIPVLGFNKQSYQAIVDGCIQSVKNAQASLTKGTLTVGTGTVQDGNINRSQWAYLANPQAERDSYASSTDTTMTVLGFKRSSDGKNMGMLTWYPVHGTSAYNNNTYVTGDNKGVAATMTEQAYAQDANSAPGFVAAYSQANVGDTSPRVLGQWCDDGSGQQCSLEASTCADGTATNCNGRRPFFEKGDQGLSSCYEIGRRQHVAAKSIFDSLATNGTPLVGTSVKSFHFFNDMRYFQFQLPNGTAVQTCPAALGYSFAAGTSDGPGVSDFKQGDAGLPNAQNNVFWQAVSNVIQTPSAQQVACQGAKPILLDVGEMMAPYPWIPNIVDVQLLRVGQLVMIVSPGEATTMTGRRWKAAVHDAAKTSGVTGTGVEPIVVLGGPANSYSGYIVTPEEYEVQRYEGASTMYGKWTGPAYMNLTVSNINYLAAGNTGSPSQTLLPPDNRGVSLSFIAGVVYDNPALGKSFGQVLTQPAGSYARGATVKAVFQGANPRNNLRLGGTFAAVDQLVNGQWTQVRSDADWFFTYTWTRVDGLLGSSTVSLAWETAGDGAPAGTYRLHYYGDSKTPITGSIKAFEGVSSSFTLV